MAAHDPEAHRRSVAEPDPLSLPPLPGLGAGPLARAQAWWHTVPVERRPLVGAGLAAALVLALVVGWSVARPEPAAREVVLPQAGQELTPAPAEAIELVVHAAGAVRHPGVYRVPDGSRVADLIDAAGGPTADADLDRLNLAAEVRDGDRVYVPEVGEPVEPATVGSASGVVDLNRATAADLEALPGIGPAIASAILDWRDRHGPFTSVDQLIEVRGIGEAKLAQLRDRVRV